MISAGLVAVITVADLAAAIPRMVSVGQWTAPQFRREAGRRRALALATVFHAEALATGLDTLLVAAVAANESGFHANAIGRGGERGIMQLHPRYAARFCGASLAAKVATDVAANVRCGCMILAYWRDRLGPDPARFLPAYTCGNSRRCRRGRGVRYAARILARMELARLVPPRGEP